MKKGLVRHRLDSRNLPPLTAEQKAQLKVLEAMSDEDVDFSDAPITSADQWATAIRNPFYKPVKALTSVRIDADVLNWLKSQGRGYQTKINAILRLAMMQAATQQAGPADQ